MTAITSNFQQSDSRHFQKWMTWALKLIDQISDKFSKHAIKALLDTAPRIVMGGVAIAFLSVMVLGLFTTNNLHLQAFGIIGAAFSLYMIMKAIKDDEAFAFVGTIFILPVCAVMIAACLTTNQPDWLMYAGVKAITLSLGLPIGMLVAFEILKTLVHIIGNAFGVGVPNNLVTLDQTQTRDSFIPIGDVFFPVGTPFRIAVNHRKLKLAVGAGIVLASSFSFWLMFALLQVDMTIPTLFALAFTGMWVFPFVQVFVETRRAELSNQIDHFGIGTSQFDYVAARRGKSEYADFQFVPYATEKITRNGTRRLKFYRWRITSGRRKWWTDTEYDAYRLADRLLERHTKAA